MLLALVMCLLVLVVAGVVLRDALRDGTANRATTARPTGRGRLQERCARRRQLHAARQPRRPPAPRAVRPTGAPRPASGPMRGRSPARAGGHPVRSALTLVLASVGTGVLLAVTLGALAVGAALALRAVSNG